MTRKRKPAPRPAPAARLAPGLSAAGALAARFGGAPADPFRELGIDLRRLDLGDAGAYLAQELVECADRRWLDPRERLGLALALLATQVAARQGSTRVPLDPAGPLRELVGSMIDGDPTAALDALVRVTGPSLARGGGLVGDPGEVKPLIVDDGCLYQHRLWWLETHLAARLAARIAAPPLDEPARIAAAVDATVARPARITLSAQQVAAVRTALAGRLGVISGGPGTGKTAIVVALVRALRELGVTEIALAAPTGKAANRISESVERDLAEAPLRAQTLHRLLGWRPGGEYRHGELAPLPQGAVIVDEASMVDVAVMERLVRAVRADARLILLGDAHQLPSVDAGAVLADLVGLARTDGAPWAIELTESHRMREDDPAGRRILEAARAIDTGQARRLVDERLVQRRIAVGYLEGQGVELVTVENVAQLGAALDAWWDGYRRDGRFVELTRRAFRRHHDGWDPVDQAALHALLGLHEERRLLAVTRGLPTGTAAINARLHARTLELATAELSPDFLPGEPVLITANDYERGLFNGDQGVVVRVVDDDGVQRWRAVFRRGADLVPLPIDAVRASLELAWAMTVHKSQGSELDRIALVLPHGDLPLLTRELLYTALTRARRGACLLGAWEVVERGAARTAARHSGLAGRLRGA